MRQRTKFGMENQGFLDTAHIIAGQCKQPGIERQRLKRTGTSASVSDTDFN